MSNIKRWGARIGVYVIALHLLVFDGVFAIVRLSDTLKASAVEIPGKFARLPLDVFLWTLIGVSCWAIVISGGLFLLKDWARKNGVVLSWIGLALGVYALLGSLGALVVSGTPHQSLVVIVVGIVVKVGSIHLLGHTAVRQLCGEMSDAV